MCITVSIRRSEEKSLESIQPNHVDSGDQTQGVRLICKPLYGSRHLTGSNTISSIVEIKAFAPENPNYDVKINLFVPWLLWMSSQVGISETVAWGQFVEVQRRKSRMNGTEKCARWNYEQSHWKCHVHDSRGSSSSSYIMLLTSVIEGR